jgi:sugar/nucleoside kinase (ribokinase family)
MKRVMRVAVVGHVEWIEFARVPRVPRPGEIVHATEWWQDVGGGGAVAAVQLAKLAGEAEFFTALATDDLGARSQARLEELGVRVHAAPRPAPQRSRSGRPPRRRQEQLQGRLQGRAARRRQGSAARPPLSA